MQYSTPTRLVALTCGAVLLATALLAEENRFGLANTRAETRGKATTPNLLFSDGFESGDLSAWSTVVGDEDPPLSITASAGPAPNEAGWNRSEVTVLFDCAGGQGIVSCPEPVRVVSEGTGQRVVGTAVDEEGEQASVEMALNIDLTPPLLALRDPAPGTTVASSPLGVTGTASDALSGMAEVSCNGYSAMLAGGSFSCDVSLDACRNEIVVEARDVAGNSTRLTLEVTLDASLGSGDCDSDGLDETVEGAAPGNGDGDGDGVPDAEQPHVASLPNAVDGRYITLASVPGSSLVQVASIPIPSPGDTPTNAEFPLDFVAFEIHDLVPGEDTVLTLHLPENVPLSTYFKYGPTPDDPLPHWYEFLFDGSTGARLLEDRVELHFIDGERGDDDLLADGRIIDAGAPGTAECGSSYLLARHQAFECVLPVPPGQTQASWVTASLLPPGLHLAIERGRWALVGTVTENAPLEIYRLGLELTAPGVLLESRQISFSVGSSFNLWTQNTLLRPDDLVPDSFYASCFFSPVACGIALGAEATWDALVSNTSQDNRQRATRIAQRFGRFDIVALQEVFDEDQRDQFRGGLAQHAMFDGPGTETSSLSFLDSGLALLTKTHLPTTPVGEGTFDRDCSGIDCRANKGFTVHRVQLTESADHYVYVVNTHTNASDNDAARATRAAQIPRLKAFIDALADPAHPTLFVGDMNVIETDGERAEMLSMLGLNDGSDLFKRKGPRSVSLRYTSDPNRNAYARNWFGEPPARLDYVLARQGTLYRIDAVEGALTDELVETPLCHEEDWFTGEDAPPNPPKCYLSDHFGLAMSLRFSRQFPIKIIRPEDGMSFRQCSETVRLRAELRPDLANATVTWSSSEDGDLGSGTARNITLDTVGDHTILARLTTDDGFEDTASLRVTVIADGDCDGLSEEEEAHYRTDPNNPDTDGDQLLDGQEIEVGSNPLWRDSDDDGLLDGEEVHGYDTSPTDVDSDGDGVRDGAEVLLGSGPKDQNQTPSALPVGTLLAMASSTPGGASLAILDPATGRVGTLTEPNGRFGFGLAFDDTGTLYLAIGDRLLVHEPLSGASIEIGAFVDPSGAAVHVTQIAFDPARFTLFGIEEGPSFEPTGQLVRIDRATALVERVGAEGPDALHALEVTRTGTLYATVVGTVSDRFIEIDPVSGDVSPGAQLGVEPIFGMATTRRDAVTGNDVLYASNRRGNDASDVFTVDPVTSVATPLSSVERAVFGLDLMPCPSPCFEAAAGSPLAVGESWDLAVGDIDADGDLDVAAIGSGSAAFSSQVSLLAGDGTGSFTPLGSVSLPDYELGGGLEDSLELAHLDGNATLDLVVADQSLAELRVFLGDGNGGFNADASSPYSVVGALANTLNGVTVADVTGDGFADILATGFNGLAGFVSVFEGSAGGPFAQGPGFPGGNSGARNVDTGLIDGDLHLDVVNGSFYGGVVANVSGVGELLIEGPNLLGPFEVATGDLNGDTFADLVIADVEGGQLVILLWNDASSEFEPPAFLPLAGAPGPLPAPWTVAIADVTGDGRLDIVTGNRDAGGRNVTVAIGRGDGTFYLSRSTASTGDTPTGLRLGDVNGDGRVDALVSVAKSGAGVEVFLASDSF